MANGSGNAVAWTAVLLAAAATGLALRAGSRAAKAPEGESDADLSDPKSLEGRLNGAEGRLEALEKRVQSLAEGLARAEAKAEEASGLARNTARTVEERLGSPLAGKGRPEDAAPAEADPRKVEADSLLAMIREGRIPEGGIFAHFQKAKDLGVLDQALAEMEKYAAAHPDDPDAQVDLGGAYIVKLMAVPDGMERGTWSMKSLNACEAALKIEPEHWSAQYMKGMNLSQWPAFLGRQPEAIRTFEKLIEQQERSAPDPKFTQTYYQLGNTYRAAGNLEKARKVFARGLEIFPEDKQLKEQVELLDKK
jgi:tetratricopeptide (TPR) repeat protein